MYTIPSDFDVEQLNGTNLIQVSFSLNTITLFFDRVGSIGISGSFSVQMENGDRQDYGEIHPIRTDLGLLSFLDESITQIGINEMRDRLTVGFSNGGRLEMIGDEMYESYTIKVQGREVIV